MIYSMYFAGIYNTTIGRYWADERTRPLYNRTAGKTIPVKQRVADRIKNSTNDTFVFVITNTQEEAFRKYLNEYKLNDLIVYEMPYYVTNANHPTQGRRLKVVVLASPVHFWRDWYEEEETMENVNAD